MTQIQRPLRIPLEAKVQRLDPRRRRAAGIRVALELQPRAPEAVLRLKDALVRDGHLEGLVRVRVEPRAARVGRELDNVAPLELLALDVLSVELGRAVAVKVGRGGRGGYAPVEDERALDHAGADAGRAGAAAGAGGDAGEGQAEEGWGVHLDGGFGFGKRMDGLGGGGHGLRRGHVFAMVVREAALQIPSVVPHSARRVIGSAAGAVWVRQRRLVFLGPG